MKKIIGIAAVCLLGLSAIGLADTVYLRNGQVFKGKIVAEDDDSVTIRTNYGVREDINRRQIDRVSIDEAPLVRTQAVRAERRRERRLARAEAASPAARSSYSPYREKNYEIIPKLGLDFGGTHRIDNTNFYEEGVGNGSFDGSQSVNAGLTVAGEFIKYLNPHVGLGGGLAIQFPRSLANSSGDFNFVPFYGAVRIRTTPVQHTYGYFEGQLGYNFLDGDDNYRGPDGSLGGGLYTGIGGGVVIRGVQFELLYTVNRGSASNDGYLYDTYDGQYHYYHQTGDITYSKLGFSVGYAF